jgi:exopolysaccharide production protein ExoQ
MGSICLLLSLLYSTFMVVRDCRRRRNVSSAVWIPTFFLMILGSRPISMWVAGGRLHGPVELANDVASSSLDQIFYLSVLGGSFLLASMRGVRWGRIFAANKTLMIFYFYFAMSILWSSDPGGSFKRLIKDFGLLFVAALIFTEKDPMEAVRAIYVRCAFFLLPLSMVFIKWFPIYGRVYGIGGEMTLTGVTTQKNSLGEIVLIFSLFLVWDYLEMRRAVETTRRKNIPWALIALLLNGGWLLHLSDSKTATVCTIVGIFLIVRSGRLLSKTISRLVFIGALSLPFLVFFSQQFGQVIAPLMAALGRDMTFTGRTEIWQHININTVNPLIGYGYWNFWGGPGGDLVNQAMRSLIPNAHNGYLDLYLDGGILGLSVLFLMLLATGNSIIRRLKPGSDENRYQRVRLAFVVAAIIYNLSESTFARMGPIWLIALMMIADFPASAFVRRPSAAVRHSSSLAFNRIPPSSAI